MAKHDPRKLELLESCRAVIQSVRDMPKALPMPCLLDAGLLLRNLNQVTIIQKHIIYSISILW